MIEVSDEVAFTRADILLAQEEALKSPCSRRKYGAVITDGVHTIAASNSRVSGMCNDGCIRQRMGLMHGASTDVGAEVHAEQAAVVLWKRPVVPGQTQILVQGYKPGSEMWQPMHGADLFPCMSCARILKFSGFRVVHVTDRHGSITPVELSEIIEYWESALEPVD